MALTVGTGRFGSRPTGRFNFELPRTRERQERPQTPGSATASAEDLRVEKALVWPGR